MEYAPENSHLPPLTKQHRHFVFLAAVAAFVIAVPTMVFYAVGYRFDFSESFYNIKSVGGLYISSPVSDANIFVDDELVEDIRIFRAAAYIQNLEAGVHEVYVERDGLHTWVKELPVFAHLVTEAQSFNMPLRPQVRLLTEWTTDAGIGVVFDQATSTQFGFASTTNFLLYTASSSATTTLNPNLEHEYIASRFASSSAEAALLEQYRLFQTQRFAFPSDLVTAPTTSATTTRIYRDMWLFEREGEVYAEWRGDPRNVPYYFCMTNMGDEETRSLYGTHAYAQLQAQLPAAIDLSETTQLYEQFCRDTIRIDRLQQTVRWFDFLPDTEHLVLMLLDDGLYVVEIDDRAWQNTQQLYPGTDIEVLIDGGRIFVKDGSYYLEVFTEIADQ